MLLTPTNILIIICGLALTWLILFSLFNEKSSLQLGIKLGILVLALSPLIAKYSYDTYARLSRQWFIIKDFNGEIQLPYSPMRISKKNFNKDYCDQFKDEKGNPVNEFTVDNNNVYCGAYWGMYNNTPIFLPYKLIDKNRAIYWASPELKIVGPAPKYLEELKKDKSNKSSAIFVTQGTQAAFIVKNEFELPTPNSKKKLTIASGSTLSGFAVDNFSANEELGYATFKIPVDSYSCTAIAKTHAVLKKEIVIAKIISLDCFNHELKSVSIQATANVRGRLLSSN